MDIKNTTKTLESNFDNTRSINEDSRIINSTLSSNLNDSKYIPTSKDINQKINKYFLVGEKVHIILDLDLFKQVQDGHGGWQPKMANLIGQIGKIHRITEKGDFRVEYENDQNSRWTINPLALNKIDPNYVIGDFVVILGMPCKIVAICSDSNLCVSFNSQVFNLDKIICYSLPKNINELFAREFRDFDDQPMDFKMKHLIDKSATGNLETVMKIISKYPNLIDQNLKGETPLYAAAFQGHQNIVNFLIDSNANLEIKDNDGDTALHYSCFGNQPKITEILITRNCDINSVNKNGCSALHVAVNKQHMECVKVLLKYKIDCNIQDNHGDTVLHDIVGKPIINDTKHVIDLIFSNQKINLELKNKRGFNIWHHACLKGNILMIEKLLKIQPDLINSKKDDGFTGLHLAALNGHLNVINYLVKNKMDIEIRNNSKQTSLMIAMAKLHIPIIDYLIEHNANLNVVDEDGDSCLHIVLNQEYEKMPSNKAKIMNDDSNLLNIKSSINFSKIQNILPSEFTTNIRMIIATFLIKNGADLNAKNKNNLSCLDFVHSSSAKEFLKNQYLMTILDVSQMLKSNMPNNLSEKKCKLCDEEPCLITFNPCMHKNVCLDCSIRLKRCPECNQEIKEKQTINGTTLNINKIELSELLIKIKTLEEAQTCSICMERKKDTAFQCGHIICNMCSNSLKTCHICREKIIKRIKIYEA